MAYRYPDNRPKNSAVTGQTWNWSSPPQVNPPAGSWITSPEDSYQQFGGQWNWSSPPQTYPSNTSYAGNMRMASQNGYGFQGELVRSRNSVQPPPLTSTPKPELYGNHAFYGMSFAGGHGYDQGLTEVLASYATRKSTVVFMDSKAISKGRHRNMKRCLLLLLLLLVGVGTLIYWKAIGTQMKPGAQNRPDLPSIPEGEYGVASSVPAQEPLLPNLKPPARLVEAESSPIPILTESQPTLTTSGNPRDIPELLSNSVTKEKEPDLQVSQIKEQTAEHVAVHKKADTKVIYAFDDDDRDLTNEARVETVIEKQAIIVDEEPVTQKPGTESKNKPKEKMPPRRAYPYPGPIPVMRNAGNRH